MRSFWVDHVTLPEVFAGICWVVRDLPIPRRSTNDDWPTRIARTAIGELRSSLVGGLIETSKTYHIHGVGR